MHRASAPRLSARCPRCLSLLIPLFLAFALSGCSLLRKDTASTTAPSDGTQVVSTTDAPTEAGRTGRRDAFTVVVQGPEEARDYLTTHLDLQRYRQLDDLSVAEISRLMLAAEPNARALLATLGHFAPTLDLQLKDTPGAPRADHEVVLTVEPGPRTQVSDVRMVFRGDITEDVPASRRQRNRITRDWDLPAGDAFTQSAWDAAKSASQKALTDRRYPTGNIAESRADVDADTHKAALSLTFDSGPAYRFGDLRIVGAERYSIENALRIARLPKGADYDQRELLDAQARLASSGYFDSVFLTLDTEGTDPKNVPVVATVREAPLQKVVFGVGYSTDSGPRISIDHTHNRIPFLDWRAVSTLSLDGKIRSIGTDLTGLLDNEGWRWFGAAKLEKEDIDDYTVSSGRARYGRSKGTDHIDRSYYLQYDYADKSGNVARETASAASVNWGWTGRYFDNNQLPRSGQGLALEAGAGMTMHGKRLPFTRVQARWLGLVPAYRVTTGEGEGTRSRRARVQLRAEAGAVLAKEDARIPATLQFLTGGDTTVRGYEFREIGTSDSTGATVAGRYMNVLSAELQHPIARNGEFTDFEGVAFVDAGAVADKPRQLKYKAGVGVGVRWNSPVGLVQADVAYGEATKAVRLHLRLGFTF